MAGLTGAVFAFVFAIVGVFILAFIINALAPTFGAQKDSNKAFKVAVYSYTPAWIAGALQILPALAILGVLAALYGLYLLYLGLPALMKAPQDKAIGYTAVVVVCAIVLSIVVDGHRRSCRRTRRPGRYGLRILFFLLAEPSSLPIVRWESSRPLGRKMEESGAKMEQAQKSGDTAAETAAAFEGLGSPSRRRQARGPGQHRSVEAAGAGPVRRVGPAEQQRGAQRHGRHHGRQSGGLVWRRGRPFCDARNYRLGRRHRPAGSGVMVRSPGRTR